MIRLGALSTGYMAELKGEKKQIRDAIRSTPANQAGELQLEYAEKCEALGHAYRQKGNKLFAQCEFTEADVARQNAA